MNALATETGTHTEGAVAERNRRRLRDAGVFAVNVVGGPGCGKTSLIATTIDHLRPDLAVGVIACDVASHRDADRLACPDRQVVQVNTGAHGAPDAADIARGLDMLDLAAIDVLFIENVGTLVGAAADLGQDVTAAVFSVAGGHEQPAKHADVVEKADIVVLNKTDLLPAVPFDLDAFRADVQRLNPAAPVYELSALHGTGLQPLLDRLAGQKATAGAVVSGWFG